MIYTDVRASDRSISVGRSMTVHVLEARLCGRSQTAHTDGSNTSFTAYLKIDFGSMA